MPKHVSSTLLVRSVAIFALVATGVAQALVPRPAAAAGAQLSLSRSVALPGASMTVKGSGFQHGDHVLVQLVTTSPSPASRRLLALGTGTDSGGAFAVSFTVPKGAESGIYAVTARDSHGDAAAGTFQVAVQLGLTSGKSASHVSVMPGAQVVVTGSGFKSGERVTVEATFPLYGGARKVTKTVTANTKGDLAATTMLVPPLARDGKVALTATGQQSGKAGMATATLTVVHRPFLILASPQMAAGETVAIQGGGFVPGALITVAITIDRTATSSVTLTKRVKAGGQGNITVGFSLPRDAHPGTYGITATGSIAHLHATARLAVQQAPSPKATATAGPTAAATTAPTAAPAHVTVTVAPVGVIPGADAEVRGNGFVPNTQSSITAQIKRTNGAPATLQVTAKVNGKGAFTAGLHTPGDSAGGTYTVTVKGANSRTATARLVIAVLKPSIVVLPAEAVPGTMITVNGFGFSSGTKVTIYLAGQSLGTTTASASGAFKTSLKVPGNRATGMYQLTAQSSSGNRASTALRVFRTITTRFYFASLYTGAGFHEYLLLENSSEIRAGVHITYQLSSGAPRHASITVPAHSRVTHDVNADIGGGVNASAVIATDVPISAERMVLHGAEGSLDPGTTTPSRIWYFSNGNTSHQYQEYIAVQNPGNSAAQVTLQVQPTHSHTFYLHRTMPPQSRTTWHLNSYSHDAIGVVVTASAPVVANRTIFIHNGLTSKTGVSGPSTRWYFAAGPRRESTRAWIGVINTTGRASHMTLRAYNSVGSELTTITRWLKPYAREGYLMNRYAGQTDVAVVVTTTQPSISEQSTFISGSHDAHTDSFGVTTFKKTVQFADATTLPHQDNLLSIFNPNVAPIPVVVQFLNQHGGTQEHTYIVSPLAHEVVDVGRVVPNSQLSLLVASSAPFVAIDRQLINDGAGAMTTLGTES